MNNSATRTPPHRALDPDQAASEYNLGYRHGVLETLQLLTGPERATLLRQVFDEKE